MASTLALKRVAKLSSTIGRAASTAVRALAASVAINGTSSPSSSGASATA